MRQPRAALALVTAAIALVVALGVSAPASASTDHWVYNQGYVWTESNGDHCLKLRTSLTADVPSADKTAVHNGAKEDVPWPPGYACSAGLQWWVDPPINPGYDADYTELYWALVPGSDGVFCMKLPYKYNDDVMGAGGLNQDHTWKDANIRSCFTSHHYDPDGYISAWGWSGVYYNGAWRGGWVFSGWHVFDR